MSISQYSIYAKSCIELAKSIIIKSDAVADAINLIDAEQDAIYRALGKPSFYDKEDKRTWRYYLNMAGQYHELDRFQFTRYNPDSLELDKLETTEFIKVMSLDTYEEIDFTIENLRQHRATRREYQKGSTYYRRLVEKYPNKRLLIDGILNPIDINKAIAARDNQILYYDKSYVEENEYTLIFDIQKMIDIFFERWDNWDYAIIDNLYIPARLGILYLYLPYMIMGARYDKSRTIEAHSFHVWGYLGSHQYLDEFRYHLNLFQRMWFYRNIRWSEINVGKMSTWRKHIEVVMTERNLPVSEFGSRRDFEEMELNKKVHFPNTYMERLPLNLEDLQIRSDRYKGLIELVNNQITESRDNQIENNQIIDRLTAVDAFNHQTQDEQLSTKVVETRVHDSSNSHAIKRYDVDLNEWIYMTTKNMYTARISVANPTTAEFMNMTQKEALVMYIFALLKANGIEPDLIPTITATRVLKLKKPTVEEIRKLMDGKRTSYLYAYAVEDPVFEPTKIISTEEFAEFTDRVWNLKNQHRQIYSFTYDYREHVQVKTMTEQFYDTVVCQLTDKPMTFEEFFKARTWKLEDTAEEIAAGKQRWNSGLYSELAVTIFKYATGNDLVKKTSPREVLGMMTRLLKKISSYSVQFIQDVIEEDIDPIDWPYLRYSKNGDFHEGKWYTNMNCLDFTQHRAKMYHQEKEHSLMGKFIDGLAASSRTYSKDQLNLILDMNKYDVSQQRTRLRLPSVSIGKFRTIDNTPVPKIKETNPWKMDKFKVHAGTENYSFVEVDDDHTLHVGGVVYVKNNYRGKQ